MLSSYPPSLHFRLVNIDSLVVARHLLNTDGGILLDYGVLIKLALCFSFNALNELVQSQGPNL